MTQTALRPEDEFRKLLLSKLPPTIAPVSYTHLDVYKRQLCGLSWYGGTHKNYPVDAAA